MIFNEMMSLKVLWFLGSIQGIVGSGLCYVVMSWCVKQRGPVFTAAFSPFIQAFVAVFDISILHEEVHLGRCPLHSSYMHLLLIMVVKYNICYLANFISIGIEQCSGIYPSCRWHVYSSVGQKQ